MLPDKYKTLAASPSFVNIPPLPEITPETVTAPVVRPPIFNAKEPIAIASPDDLLIVKLLASEFILAFANKFNCPVNIFTPKIFLIAPPELIPVPYMSKFSGNVMAVTPSPIFNALPL